MLSEPAADHPFEMYKAILKQPEAFEQVLQNRQAQIEALALQVANCQQIFLVGTGTSHHAAQVGQYLFRANSSIAVQALPAFDFALYGPELKPQDCVIAISHRGNKHYTLKALERARQANCLTILITGAGVEPGPVAKVRLTTVAQEKSSAHTISYLGSVAVLALLAAQVGQLQAIDAPLSVAMLKDLPQKLQTALETETLIQPLAQQYQHSRRLWLVGGGPSAITAQEIALKIKETSYLQAEGMAIEALLHGPFQCAAAEDLFILIAPQGAAQGRTLQLLAMIQAIAAQALIITDQTEVLRDYPQATVVTVPPVPEPLSTLTCLIPLQLLSYYLAVAAGTNPDSFRLDDPQFAHAWSLVQL